MSMVQTEHFKTNTLMPHCTLEKEHLLHCPKLDTDQQVLKNTIKLLGCQSDDDDITSPSTIGTTTILMPFINP
jgi:hypothetical protein